MTSNEFVWYLWGFILGSLTASVVAILSFFGIRIPIIIMAAGIGVVGFTGIAVARLFSEGEK